jgi:hypothetical protein
VYPSAYANGWASKWYKGKGGSWKSVSEEIVNEEDAYDKDAKPSDKPHDKDAATKRAKIAAIMARKKMAKEEVEQIDELSNDMLGRYKTAAGADASKADKAGDYNKGNKRFSGIMKATKKQMANDIITRASTVTEAKEKTEYDYEGDMARGQLQSIINNAQKVHDMLKDNDNLPEWVQSKITLAEDYISTVANYLMSEIDEQVEQIDEREDDEYNSVRDHKVGVVVSKDNGPKERLKATMRAKEPQQAVNAALKHYKSKGYTVHEHKYLGEALADDKYGSAASETLVTKPHKELIKKMKESKDNSPPFDGPYTKDKGTVTDKSGAKHTPMSRARNLARQAMKKQSDSLKAPPSRLGEESSRKAEIVKSAAKKKKMNSKEDTFQSEPEISSTITKNY